MEPILIIVILFFIYTQENLNLEMSEVTKKKKIGIWYTWKVMLPPGF